MAAASSSSPKVEETPEEEPPVVKELKTLDDQYLDLKKEADKAIQEIQQKYKELQKPLLEERASILARGDEETGTPGAKGFWWQALTNHPNFEELIMQWDKPVLEYLKNITTEYVDASNTDKGFKLSFHFATNPYFTNIVLEKTYLTEMQSPYVQDLDINEIISSAIDWKHGKDVTVEKVTKKVKGGGAKKAKQKAKETLEPRESFFRDFFRNLKPDMPLPDDIILDPEMHDEHDDDDEEIMQMYMERDLEVGSALREQIIPFAVRWYTGEASPDSDTDDEDDEEEDDDDDDEADEDSEDDPPASKKKGGSKAPAQKQEECKQQ